MTSQLNTIHSFPIEDDLVLFDQCSSQLFRLNKTAAYIWQGLELGCAKGDLARSLAESTGISTETLDKDITALVKQWHSLGLRGRVKSTDEDAAIDNLSFPVFELDDNEIVPKLSRNNPHIIIDIIDIRVKLFVPSNEEWSIIKPVFSHLLSDNGDTCDVELYLVKSNLRYILIKKNKPVDWCQTLKGVAPMIHANTAVIAYDHTSCFLGLHAAAVCHQGKGILLPAISGSGKSTLTAALVAEAFEYCADDLVLLSEPPIQMRTVPIAIGLKSGSWNPIKSYHPIVSTLDTHVRLDEKKVRYLYPNQCENKNIKSKSLPVDFILFPKFVAGNQRIRLKRVSTAKGLCHLTEAGFDIPSKLDVTKVEQLIDWISSIPMFKLTFGKLDEAVGVIKSLVNEQRY
jgi:hypothetical protein